MSSWNVANSHRLTSSGNIDPCSKTMLVSRYSFLIVNAPLIYSFRQFWEWCCHGELWASILPSDISHPPTISNNMAPLTCNLASSKPDLAAHLIIALLLYSPNCVVITRVQHYFPSFRTRFHVWTPLGRGWCPTTHHASPNLPPWLAPYNDLETLVT